MHRRFEGFGASTQQKRIRCEKSSALDALLRVLKILG